MKNLKFFSPLFVITVLGLLALFTDESHAECPVPKLPNQFQIDERVFAWSNTLDLKTSNSSAAMGTLTERILSWTRTFDYLDSQKNKIASAEESFLTWGTEVKVFDCANAKIGTIKEQVFKSFWRVTTLYSILDAFGSEVATSEKVDWLQTRFTLKDKKGNLIATLERPAFVWVADTWKVQLAANAGAVDPRLMVMIAAFKTSVDNSRRSSN